MFFFQAISELNTYQLAEQSETASLYKMQWQYFAKEKRVMAHYDIAGGPFHHLMARGKAEKLKDCK